jgi:hypothetical protein
MKLILLTLSISLSALFSFGQDKAAIAEFEKYLSNIDHDINGLYLDSYVEKIDIYDIDEEGNEVNISEYYPIEFTINLSEEVLQNKDVVSIPLNKHHSDDFEHTYPGFYLNLINKESGYQLASVSTPYTHYFNKIEKDEKHLFVLGSIASNALNCIKANHNELVSKEYTESEIKSHFLSMLEAYEDLSDSNYLFIEQVEMGDTAALGFYMQEDIAPHVDDTEKTIQLKVKAYKMIEDVEWWGDLYQMTDDMSFNYQLREQQEKASAEFFTLSFQYYNSYPKPTFSFVGITLPSALQWKPLAGDKFILRMKVTEK